MSSVHKEEIEGHPEVVEGFLTIFQNAIYGPVGLLASQTTREIIVFARLGCQQYLDKALTYAKLRKRIQAVSLALRSDLGISQSVWPSVVERIRDQGLEDVQSPAEERVHAMDELKKYDYLPHNSES
jgi:hypothetical protein